MASLKRQLLLISSSKVLGYGYLEYAKEDILAFFKKNNVKNVLFIPFALAHHEDYTNKIKGVLADWGIPVRGLNEFADKGAAVNDAQLIYIGGGNTFLLLKTLYDYNLIEPIRKRVFDGIPYMGASAGTNVSTKSIHTTNDMPIIFPPSFDALNLVPFNINPHYLDPTPDNPHQGETREERINQFHELNEAKVLGLREGTALLVDDKKATLIGLCNARLFQKGQEPIEYAPNSDLSFLLS